MAVVQLSSSDIIDATLRYVDGVKDPADAAHVDRRTRYVQFLQELVIAFWMLKEWPWSMRTATLVAPNTAGRASLPLDFLEIGRIGSIVDTATLKPFDSVTLGEMQILLASHAKAVKNYIYAIGVGADAAATRYLWFPTSWYGVATLAINYKRIPPLVADGVTDEIAEIPTVYQYNVLLPGMRYRGFDDSSDSRADRWYREFEKGQTQALSTERVGSQRDTVRRPGRAITGHKF